MLDPGTFAIGTKYAGRSPAAYSERGSVTLSVNVDKELKPVPIYGSSQTARFIIAVASWYGSISPSEVKINADDIRQVLMGDENVYVIGRLTYTGTTKLPHISRFAYQMIFDGDASVRFQPTGPDSYWENS